MVEAANTDPCDSMSREEIKDYLCAIAERHIVAAPTYKSIKTDASKDLNVWQGVEGGVALTVSMLNAEGLTMDDFIAFNNPDVFAANMHVLDPILNCRRLDD